MDAVGTFVGESVGDVVGEVEGDAVGTFVGDTVGDSVGAALGDTVGLSDTGGSKYQTPPYGPAFVSVVPPVFQCSPPVQYAILQPGMPPPLAVLMEPIVRVGP